MSLNERGDAERWTCGRCGHEGSGSDLVEWYEHTKVCHDRADALAAEAGGE